MQVAAQRPADERHRPGRRLARHAAVDPRQRARDRHGQREGTDHPPARHTRERVGACAQDPDPGDERARRQRHREHAHQRVDRADERDVEGVVRAVAVGRAGRDPGHLARDAGRDEDGVRAHERVPAPPPPFFPREPPRGPGEGDRIDRERGRELQRLEPDALAVELRGSATRRAARGRERATSASPVARWTGASPGMRDVGAMERTEALMPAPRGARRWRAGRDRRAARLARASGSGSGRAGRRGAAPRGRGRRAPATPRRGGRRRGSGLSPRSRRRGRRRGP